MIKVIILINYCALVHFLKPRAIENSFCTKSIFLMKWFSLILVIIILESSGHFYGIWGKQVGIFEKGINKMPPSPQVLHRKDINRIVMISAVNYIILLFCFNFEVNLL